MRKVTSVAADGGLIFIVCADGTLWKRLVNGDGGWTFVEGPPEGTAGGKEMTVEEAVARLQKTGRRFVIGKGLKDG